MKQLFFITFILVSIQVFSQNKKDLLLERDHDIIIEQLKFMDYLNDATMKLKGYIKRAGDTLQMPFYAYYNDSIVARNPVPSSNISSYLDYQPNQTPPSAGEFTVRVYNRNAATLYNIIKRYGYPTTAKLDKHRKIDPYRPSFIIQMASDEWKKILYPIIKDEDKKGNITELEYTFCKIAFKNGIMRRKELEEFAAILKKYGYQSSKDF